MYRDEADPQAMELPQLKRHMGRFGDAAAALQVDVTLNPGESKTVVFTLGIAEDGKEFHRDFITKYTSVEAAEKP
jgi:cellobiose phosphorylase